MKLHNLERPRNLWIPRYVCVLPCVRDDEMGLQQPNPRKCLGSCSLLPVSRMPRVCLGAIQHGLDRGVRGYHRFFNRPFAQEAQLQLLIHRVAPFCPAEAHFQRYG